jgi:UDP-GlcNAc:undecaprenyl-phosphate GlcNAc-1-phosphate transferase
VYFILIVLAALGLAFIISFVMTPFARRLAVKTNALDIPIDDRRMHRKPMPLLGGLAIFVGTTIAILAVQFIFLPLVLEYLQTNQIVHNRTEILIGIQKLDAALIGGVLIFIVGLIDDYNNMKAWIKFLCQIACASMVFLMGIRVDLIFGHDFGVDTTLGFILNFLLTIIWIVGITNTINLIDGLDGLAAGVAAIASISIAYTAYIHGMYTVTLAMLALAGAALGFLPFNFNPAKIFMGDAGSLYLGFMLAVISIIGPVKSATIVATIVPVLVLGLPIFDVAFAILRRIVNKKPIMAPDKAHLHHRLIDSGMGIKRSVLMLYGISGIMGIAAIVFSRDYLFEAVGLFIIAILFILLLIWDWNIESKDK